MFIPFLQPRHSITYCCTQPVGHAPNLRGQYNPLPTSKNDVPSLVLGTQKEGNNKRLVEHVSYALWWCALNGKRFHAAKHLIRLVLVLTRLRLILSSQPHTARHHHLAQHSTFLQGKQAGRPGSVRPELQWPWPGIPLGEALPLHNGWPAEK